MPSLAESIPRFHKGLQIRALENHLCPSMRPNGGSVAMNSANAAAVLQKHKIIKRENGK